ncbi:MAG: hypothetical protein ABIH63_01995 [archaeon]
MKKKRDHERIAVALFLVGVIMICGIVFLKNPRIVGYATMEQSIQVLNKQSYAAVYDTWTVRFKTEGEGDLQISEVGDTFYYVGNIKVSCGSEPLDYEVKGGTAVVSNYNCNQVGSISMEVRNEGIQRLKFKFGNKDYASNTAVRKENI